MLTNKHGVRDADKFVDVNFHPPGFDSVDIFLFNFDVGSARLKPQHVKWMNGFFGDDDFSVEVWQSFRLHWGVLISGETSLTGGFVFDEILGGKRADAVQKYLMSPLHVTASGLFHDGVLPTKIRLDSPLDIRTTSLGKSHAKGKTREDARDRQAVVQIWDTRRSPFPPPLAVRPALHEKQWFRTLATAATAIG